MEREERKEIFAADRKEQREFAQRRREERKKQEEEFRAAKEEQRKRDEERRLEWEKEQLERLDVSPYTKQIDACE